MGMRSLAATLLVLAFGTGTVWAQQTVGPIPVSASVDTLETFDCTILQDNVTGQIVTSMDFGQLDRPTNPDGTPGALGGLTFFQVYCGASASGASFQVTQTAGTLTGTNSGDFLPDGAWIFTPLDGVGGDPGTPLPSGSVVGSQGTAAGTNVLWYTSDPAGTGTTIASTYGISNDPANGAFEFIPPDQTADTYSTTVTWTMTVLP
ncbi:MAG TPA: hypothetical protein VGB20_00985 [bacterium]